MIRPVALPARPAQPARPQAPARSPATRPAGALVAALGLALATACTQPKAPPSLCLLVSVDTLRADALGCYGGPKESSPHLDALASRGVRFERVYSQAPNTATSHASLFTGLLPFAHRVANITSLEFGTPGLSPGFVTLAECFLEAGFETAAFTDDGPLGRGWNLMQGFEVLEAKLEGIEAKVQQAERWLAERNSSAPAFLFLHTYEVHQPYAPEPVDLEPFDSGYQGPIREAWQQLLEQRANGRLSSDGRLLLGAVETLASPEAEFLRCLYQAEVRATDRALGGLIERIDARWPRGDTLLALTSDHGEEFGEHGRFGHEQLFAECLHVPLILRLPGGKLAGSHPSAAISQFDLMPSLLEWCGIPEPEGLQARSFVAELEQGNLLERDPVAETTEGLYPPTLAVDRLRSRRSAGLAFLERSPSPEAGAPRRPQAFLPYGGALFDLISDPGERAPIYTDEAGGPPRARGLAQAQRTELERLRAVSEALNRRLAAGAGILPAEQNTVEQLRQLGYLPGR